MTCAGTWAIIVGTAGGLCELAGLFLIVRGIARDRARAREIDKWPPRRQRRARPNVLTWGDGGAKGPPAPPPFGDPPDLERMARALAQLEGSLDKRFADADERAQMMADEAHDYAAEAAWTASGEVKGHIDYVLAGSLAERKIGVGLLAAGIVAGIAANVLGNV